MMEITTTEQNLEKMKKKKNEDSLRDLWDSIRIIGVPEGEREREDPRKYFKR